MKRLSVYGLAAMVLLGAAAAQADRGDHRGGKHHWKGEHGKHYRDRHHRHRYVHPGKRRYYRGRWVRPWRDYAPRYYGPRYDYPGYLGSALIGGAVAYSLFHSHGGATCHDSHLSSSGQRYEVVGCHRIEYLPDGTQRRVEVPLSACD
ncbi:hypothetical protein [Parahaliea mediterranea]|uniref:Glycine zipper 2TM domain-containing protein n=1 Tax=Parahaliea mediterranea TaxID=651086 RepID=A0A939DGI0_9GAMM|nr:hypothetical protein [Parahaliea mediterranea]MBN7797843.1 hypothetical protein [Parahaliea mediterranea]